MVQVVIFTQLAAAGKSVVVTHIVGCRSRLRLPIAMTAV